MRHKSICPRCGQLKYLHCKEIEAEGFIPIVCYICDDCDKPLNVIILPFINEIKEGEE